MLQSPDSSQNILENQERYIYSMEQVLEWIVNFVKEFGYIGIFIMTFLESTFVPIPS